MLAGSKGALLKIEILLSRGLIKGYKLLKNKKRITT
jgi:hypothetical protein